jgi:hypothetical protein
MDFGLNTAGRVAEFRGGTHPTFSKQFVVGKPQIKEPQLGRTSFAVLASAISCMLSPARQNLFEG